MPTAAELYDAILADPDNVDLRTEYADAVADTDPEHAELIDSNRGSGANARAPRAARTPDQDQGADLGDRSPAHRWLDELAASRGFPDS